jgi:Subtilase family
MTSHPRNLLPALALLALALLPATATAQIRCENCPQRPPIEVFQPPRVNSNQIAPQIKAIQDLTDPVLISIIPGEVVNRDALNRPPPTPQLRILGQPGTPGGPGTPGTTFGKTNGMPPLGEDRFIQNELLVFAVRGLSQQLMNDILRRIGLSLIDQQSLGTLGVTVYKFHIDNANMSVRDALRALQAAFPGVPLFQPNYVYVAGQQQPDAAPASRGDGSQRGDAAQYTLEKLKLPDVHRLVKGANVPIAVIDSEIDAAHPDLQGVVAQRFSAVGAPEKPHAHGTGMAGAIASRQKVIGIAPSARLFAVHAFSSAATAESTTYNILKGIDWSVTQGARIINMSFAGPKDPALERALKAAYDRGVVLIAAAGNAGPRSAPLYPGADPNVIAVTATDVDDKLFEGANRGRYVAVAAPGVDILVPAPDGAYQLTTGTSVAAAEVSGIVALLLERNPRLTPADIRRILTGSAKRLGPGQRDDNFGAGLVDPLKALQSADPRTVSRTPPRR